MTPTVAVIIRCGDLVRQVVATTRSVETQTLRARDVVLVTDPSTPPAAQAWLESLARAKGWHALRASSLTPAVAWNEGIQASDAEEFLCVTVGDELLPECVASVAEALSDVSGGLVVGAVREVGAGAAAAPEDLRFTASGVFTKTPNPAGQVFAVSRRTWSDVGGFDRDLPALEDLDFLIRYETTGRNVTVLPNPAAIRVVGRTGLLERTWTDARPTALKEIARRYAASPDALGDVFYHAQNARTRLRLDNQRRLGRRSQAVDELAALTARAKQLRWELPPDEQHRVDLGDLRRTSPVSRDWGYERGVPIDRHYIETFLASHAQDIRGAVLEVQEPDYTERFGAGRVTRSDVVDLDSANPRATIISDLRGAANIAPETYDCIILTQTLHVIDDMEAVVSECERILKPGGVVLATLPCASRVSVEYGYNGDFWRATEAGARRLFASRFPADRIDTQSLGNVLTNAAFLYGLGGHEITAEEYAAFDPFFPMLVTVRARKPRPPAAAGVLLYHRVADLAGSDVHHLSVSPAEFERQMTVLRDSFIPMPLRELAALVRNGSVPDGAVAVTFDDGYLDNLDAASPILQRLGIPATFFCTTETMDDPAYEYWWDVLERVLLTAPVPPAELTLDWRGQRHTWPTETPADRASAHDAIYVLLASAPADERHAALDHLRHWSSDGGSTSGARRITTAELRDLAGRPGHEIGAHSDRHLMLPDQDPDTQREEVVSSQRRLAAALGRPIDLFAYPFGAWNQHVRDVVGAAGFTTAVACGDRAPDGTDDPLALPRLDPAARGTAAFADWLRRRVRPRATSPA